MPERLFAEWQAFHAASPFGPRQEEARFGVLAALAFNPNRKEGARALGPEDFFPSLKGPKIEAAAADPDRINAAMGAWAAALKARGLPE